MNSYTVVRESDKQIVESGVSYQRVLEAYTHADNIETPEAAARALETLSRHASSRLGANLSPDFRVFSSPRRALLFANA